MRNFALGFCIAVTAIVAWAMFDDFASHPYRRGIH